MREILFRGKRVDNGEWVEGSFLRDGEAHMPVRQEGLSFSDCYIVPKTEHDNVRTYLTQGILLNTVAYHIIPDSVGQYTGLKDMSGKRIFEGDVVGVHYELDGECGYDMAVVCFALGGWMLKWHDAEFIDSDAALFEWCKERLLLFGNIHDNPELMEGGNG